MGVDRGVVFMYLEKASALDFCDNNENSILKSLTDIT